MTLKEIHEIIDAFAKTAALCKAAGVDGVEVHAVHEGYLWTDLKNKKRKDQFGGSFENRYRFATAIVKKIKSACGSDYPVSEISDSRQDFCVGAMPGEDYERLDGYKRKGRLRFAGCRL